MKKFFRKLRAFQYLMVAFMLWEGGVRQIVDELSKTDPMMADFRDNIDTAWQIIRYGRK